MCMNNPLSNDRGSIILFRRCSVNSLEINIQDLIAYVSDLQRHVKEKDFGSAYSDITALVEIAQDVENQIGEME